MSDAENFISTPPDSSGVGLPEEEMSAVNEHYENINGFTESMALSLSICKLLAGIMGGTIDLSSSKGEVSKFWLWLPTKVSVS